MADPKNLPVDKIQHHVGIVTAKDIRYGLLELAGFTSQELSGLVRKSVKTLEDSLTADHTQVLSYMGQKGDEIVTPDHSVRLKAAQELLRFTDVKPVSHEIHKQTNTINYVVPEIYTPKVVNGDHS